MRDAGSARGTPGGAAPVPDPLPRPARPDDAVATQGPPGPPATSQPAAVDTAATGPRARHRPAGSSLVPHLRAAALWPLTALAACRAAGA